MHIGTFRFKTLAFATPPLAIAAEEAGIWVFRRSSKPSFFPPLEALRAAGSDLRRRTCQAGLLRPTWTPGRPGLQGHFLELESPAELLLEHGALLTFRDPAPPRTADLGRPTALFPADLLRENGHRLILSSAEVAPPPKLFRSFFFFFSFSLSSCPPLPAAADFLSVILKMSLQRLDDDSGEGVEESRGPGSDLGRGSGSGSDSEGRRRGGGRRGRRTPPANNSSAERRLVCGKEEGFRSIQNSNSGEELETMFLPLLLLLLLCSCGVVIININGPVGFQSL